MQYVWQQDSFWQVVDSGHAHAGKAEAAPDGTTLTLLERNSSHLPVIENAVARVEFFSQNCDIDRLPTVLSLVDCAHSFKIACLTKVFNTAAARSQSDEFR